MSGGPTRPPPSPWAQAVAALNADTAAAAKAEGRAVVAGAAPESLAELHPDLWPALRLALSALEEHDDALDDLDADHVAAAARRLDAAMRDAVAAEGLIIALATARHLAEDPFNLSRESLGIAATGTPRRRLREALRTLDRLPDAVMVELVEDVKLSAHEVAPRKGAPSGEAVAAAAREAAHALRRLRGLIAQAEAAAPEARGAQSSIETRAARRLAEGLWQAMGGPVDPLFDCVVVAVAGALWPDRPRPRVQTLREHLRGIGAI